MRELTRYNKLFSCFLFQYSFEALFRSQHFALLDNACREYLFLCDFFLVSGNQASELFVSVFGKVVTFFMVSVHILLLLLTSKAYKERPLKGV